MQQSGPGQPTQGWLVIASDTTIVAADDAACAIFDLAARELLGRSWAVLFDLNEEATIAEANSLLRLDRAWRGVLHRRDRLDLPPIEVELVPTEAAGGTVLMHVRAGTPSPPTRDALPASDDDTLAAQVAALEAIAALPEPSAAARAVLAALRTAIAFDWAAVLRFVTDPRLGIPGVEVVAVFPAPMAGVDRGAEWTPLDPAQASVLATGEPEFTRMLGRDPDLPSPLRRLPAFGMTSRIHVPLFDGARVAGCLVIYSAGAPLDVRDGMAVERVTRTLGAHLGAELQHALVTETAPVEYSPSPVLPVPPPLPPLPYEEQRPPAVGVDHGTTERLSALSEVVSGVAHELNNPLTAILGYAQIFHALDGAERDHAVKTIEGEAQRAARIVRNLLSFARQEPPHTALVDVEEILRRVIEVMQYSLEVDNIRTELRFAGVPMVEADRAQMEQVFLNLVNNAQQALQPGGGSIIVSTSNVAGYVRVSVADDGPGVPIEMRDRVFEPFFTTRGVGLGPGMGLSTVYGLVAQHGGRVWVDSSPSGGADFVVELPVHIPTWPAEEVPATTAPTEALRTPSTSGTTERVLVVDDELPIRALTSEILGHAGFLVTTAASGEEALRRMETVTFDLVVADMRMPGMDGATLYEHICDRWPAMQRRMIFITGDIEGERTGRRLARGDVRFLEKPFDTQALIGAIRAALDAQVREPS